MMLLGAAALLAAPDGSYPVKRSLELAELSHKEQEQRLSADLHSAVVAMQAELGDLAAETTSATAPIRGATTLATAESQRPASHAASYHIKRSLELAELSKKEQDLRLSADLRKQMEGLQAGLKTLSSSLAVKGSVATSGGTAGTNAAHGSHATHSPPSFHRARLISLRQQAEELSGRRLSEGIRQALHSAEEQAARDRAALSEARGNRMRQLVHDHHEANENMRRRLRKLKGATSLVGGEPGGEAPAIAAAVPSTHEAALSGLEASLAKTNQLIHELRRRGEACEKAESHAHHKLASAVSAHTTAQKLADSLATGGAVHTTVTKKAASTITSNLAKKLDAQAEAAVEKKTHACQLGELVVERD